MCGEWQAKNSNARMQVIVNKQLTIISQNISKK